MSSGSVSELDCGVGIREIEAVLLVLLFGDGDNGIVDVGEARMGDSIGDAEPFESVFMVCTPAARATASVVASDSSSGISLAWPLM